MTEPASPDSSSHQSQANTPSSTPRSRQLSILQALNASRVKEPKPYKGSFTDEIKALQTVFPPTFEAYQRQYTVFKDQEDIFNYIKRQDGKTYQATVAPLHQAGLSDEDRYVAIDDTVRTVFNFKHQLQYPTPRPPNIRNNERYHYSADLSKALSSLFPGLDLVVPDQEQEQNTESNDVAEDSETTLGQNTYQAETTHSEFSPSEASTNTTSTRSIERVPRTRAASRKTPPATVTTKEETEPIIPSQVKTTPTFLSTTPRSLAVKTVASPQQQRLLLGTPPNVHNTQDNHNPVQENLPKFDSRLDTGIYPSPISIKRRGKLTPESQAAKDRMQMLIQQGQQLRR